MSQLKLSKAHPPQCDAIDTAKKLAQRNDMNLSRSCSIVQAYKHIAWNSETAVVIDIEPTLMRPLPKCCLRALTGPTLRLF